MGMIAEYETYENGIFQVQIRPNDVYLVQCGIAGFFVDGKKELEDLVILLQAIVDEEELGGLSNG